METNYHSQFDNDGFYDEDVYRMHHELFGLLLMAIDRTVVVPLDFSRVFRKARERLDSEWCEKPARTDSGCCGCWSKQRRRRSSCMQR